MLPPFITKTNFSTLFITKEKSSIIRLVESFLKTKLNFFETIHSFYVWSKLDSISFYPILLQKPPKTCLTKWILLKHPSVYSNTQVDWVQKVSQRTRNFHGSCLISPQPFEIEKSHGPHLKAIIYSFLIQEKNGCGMILRVAKPP